MRDDVLMTLASRHGLPLSTVRRLAADLAEHCALIANRFEPRGDLVSVELAVVEAVGAEIGVAILRAFPRPVDPPPVKQNFGIGGPQR
jgi:hypothetical protein